MRKATADQREVFLLAIVLMIGALLMLIAGHFALKMPDTWQIRDTSMDSKLNSNDVYALYREDYDYRLAPIRTDVPNLLATGAVVNLNPKFPPPAIDFKAPLIIATTTPFKIGLTVTVPTATNTAQTATAQATVTPSPSETQTFTVTPTLTLQPTRTATRTRTPTPSSTVTNTATSLPTASQTATVWPTNTTAPATVTPSATRTITLTPTRTLTRTSPVVSSPTHTLTLGPTSTDTPTATPTNTATLTPTPISSQMPDCTITASGDYGIPISGCIVRFETDAQGAIFSMSMVSSGNLTVHWFGLPDNQTTGACAAHESNLTRGTPIINIAVSKNPQGSFTIENNNNREIVVTILVIDWTTGGCQ